MFKTTMSCRRLINLMFSSVLLVLLTLSTAEGMTVYVDADDGSDVMNLCTVPTDPCETISYAATRVTSGTPGSPNVIMVYPGVYNQTQNLETFPLTISDDFISLVGTDSATTIIDVDSTGSDALIITGKGFSVSGFTFQNTSTFPNTSTGLTFSRGGFSVSDNIFAATVGTGVYASISASGASTNVTIAPVSFVDNQFSGSDYGVDFKVGLTFDGITTGLTGTIGSITATGNTFTGLSTGFYIDEMFIVSMNTGTATYGAVNVSNNTFTNCSEGVRIEEIYGADMVDSTVTVGGINIDGNTLTDNSYGVSFDGYFGSSSGNITNTSLTVGNLSVSNNTLVDNSDTALDIDYFDLLYFYGTSTAVLGDLLVHNNTIKTDTSPVAGYGIYIDNTGSIKSIYDSVTVTTGTVTVTDNTVESDYTALYLYNYGVYYIGNEGGTDTVQVTVGATNISGNHLTSTNDIALYLDYSYLGYEQYAQTKVNAGLITVHDNDIISADYEAFYIYYYYYSGYDMNDDAELSIAGFTCTNNRMTSAGSYGAYLNLYCLGYYDLYGNSKISVGPTNISGNTISAYYEALYPYFDYVGYEMYEHSVLTMSPWTISNNILTTTNSADYAALTIYYYDYDVGSYMYDDSSATLPNWLITNNTIDVNGGYDGIYYNTYSNPDDNYGNAAVQYGSVLVDKNTFNLNKDTGMDKAINFFLDDVCEDCNESSTFSHGDITISGNTIYNVDTSGVELWFGEIGYSFDDDGKVTMGNVKISDNMIDNAPYGIYIDYDEIMSDYAAVVTLGTLDVSGNTIKNIRENGIYFDIDAFLDADISTGTLTIGKTTISSNTVTAATVGLSPASGGIWIDGEIGSGVLFAAPEVNGNTVSGFNSGIALDNLSEASMSCNTMTNNSESGLLFYMANGAFTAVNNSFIDNGLGLKIDTSSTATVTAENNWWGSASGPVACALCNKIDVGGGTVDYSPWLSVEPSAQCGGSSLFPWTMFLPAITNKAQL